jgi:hypothetical protein
MSAAAVQPLSNAQKNGLMSLAREAFLLAKQRGAVDDDADFDTWRKAQHGAACDRPPFGLREAQNDDFRLIRGHFLVILGNAEAAFYAFIGSGPEHEERRRMAYRLAAQVGTLAKTWGAQRKLTDAEAARQAWAYCLAIARDKAKGRPFDEMTATDVRNLGFTILNRRSAHAGVGQTGNRNKSQAARTRHARKPAVCSNRLPNAEKAAGLLTGQPADFRAIPHVSG